MDDCIAYFYVCISLTKCFKLQLWLHGELAKDLIDVIMVVIMGEQSRRYLVRVWSVGSDRQSLSYDKCRKAEN